jgi:hypothetical protein
MIVDYGYVRRSVTISPFKEKPLLLAFYVAYFPYLIHDAPLPLQPLKATFFSSRFDVKSLQLTLSVAPLPYLNDNTTLPF